MTSPSEPGEGAPRPLIDTASGAGALNVDRPQLERWAQAGILTPARVDTAGDLWWSMSDLRRRIADYLADRNEGSPP